MKDTETAAQQSDQNMFSSTANFFKQWEKQITGLMTAILTTLLTWIVWTGLSQPYGHIIGLAVIIISFSGAIFGSIIIGTTFNEVVAGLLSGAVSAITSLASSLLILHTTLIFFDVENLVCIFAVVIWGLLMHMNEGIYRKYENYFIPFLLFILTSSLYIILFQVVIET